VHSALAFAAAHSSPTALNHVIRTWLFAALISQHPSLPHLHSVDPEVLAIATLLHDLGLDPTGECISADKRFEVDGAEAAVGWLHAEAPVGWDSGTDGGYLAEGGNGVVRKDGYKGRKTQQIWDAIALHTTGTIALYKEPPVVAATYGM
jgi:HD superfamily phosphohydrolase YqeK